MDKIKKVPTADSPLCDKLLFFLLPVRKEAGHFGQHFFLFLSRLFFRAAYCFFR